MWFDTHTHLFTQEFNVDRSEVIQRAQKTGVNRMLLPNIDAETIQALDETLDLYDDSCLGAMGLHPTSVNAHWKENLQSIERALDLRAYLAIGEIGLDFYWDTTYALEQEEAFRTQLNWAIERNLPAIIHARNAMQRVIEIISERAYRSLRCVLHAFTGTPEEAKQAMLLPNTYIGLGGVCTFKNGLHAKVYPQLRHDRILLETDSPYLAPVPHRGKRNESSYIPLIGEKVAEFLNLTTNEVALITTENAYRLLAL